MRYSRLAFAILVCVGLSSPAAAADTVFDGVSLDELASALGAGLDVKQDTTKKGTKFLVAEGKEDIIFAYLIHCGKEARCEGVRYFAIIDKKPSLNLVNQMNRNLSYSKVGLDAEGEVVVSVEMLTIGGVTADNLLQNALMLMLRMDSVKEMINSQISSNIPSSATAADANLLLPATVPASELSSRRNAERARDGSVKLRSTPPAWKIDPALLKAYTDQVDAVD